MKVDLFLNDNHYSQVHFSKNRNLQSSMIMTFSTGKNSRVSFYLNLSSWKKMPQKKNSCRMKSETRKIDNTILGSKWGKAIIL